MLTRPNEHGQNAANNATFNKISLLGATCHLRSEGFGLLAIGASGICALLGSKAPSRGRVSGERASGGTIVEELRIFAGNGDARLCYYGWPGFPLDVKRSLDGRLLVTRLGPAGSGLHARRRAVVGLGRARTVLCG